MFRISPSSESPAQSLEMDHSYNRADRRSDAVLAKVRVQRSFVWESPALPGTPLPQDDLGGRRWGRRGRRSQLSGRDLDEIARAASAS
jgi:hypothetical protein